MSNEELDEPYIYIVSFYNTSLWYWFNSNIKLSFILKIIISFKTNIGYNTSRMNERMSHKQESEKIVTIVDPGEQGLSFTEEQWEEWITLNMDNFKGDVHGASIMMHQLAYGINDTHSKLKDKGLLDFQKPKIVVLSDGEEYASTPVAYLDDVNLVFVKKSFLEEFSKLSMTTQYDVARADGSVVYNGTILHMMQLVGVEECHHAAYNKYKKDPGGIAPLSITLEEYDARDDEYMGLRWQLRYAKNNKFPEVTITRLRTRIGQAQEIRSK